MSRPVAFVLLASQDGHSLPDVFRGFLRYDAAQIQQRGGQVIKDILNDKIPGEGINGVAGVCFVGLAESMLHNPGINLHHPSRMRQYVFLATQSFSWN